VKMLRIHRYPFASAITLLALCFGTLSLNAQQGFRQINLVSDRPGWAAHTDPNLINPWGVSFSPTSPFWVSNNGTGTSTLYDSTGNPIPLVVTTPGAPTGQVFTGGAFRGDPFVFATDNGIIAGWRGALGTTAETLYTSSDPSSSYFGLAFATTATGSYLYAANFGAGRIDVVATTGLTSLSGSFTDPNLPAGYAPFNIQKLGDALYVTYALRGANGDEVVGVGNGFVNKFDLDGNLIGRVASNGLLNAPWGVAIAPAGFGSLGGSLLVGNFGDGTIHAYDPTSGDFIGTLHDSFGGTLSIDGLWALTFGNGGSGGAADRLYFTAGIEGETHGLFGSLSPVPEPAITGTVAGVALMSLCAARLRKKRMKVQQA
jgi:uncharacterized protein (TIGR03118 family)